MMKKRPVRWNREQPSKCVLSVGLVGICSFLTSGAFHGHRSFPINDKVSVETPRPSQLWLDDIYHVGSASRTHAVVRTQNAQENLELGQWDEHYAHSAIHGHCSVSISDNANVETPRPFRFSLAASHSDRVVETNPKDNPKLGRLVRAQRAGYKASKRGQTTANQEKNDKLEAKSFKWQVVPSRASHRADRSSSTHEKDPGLPAAAATTALAGMANVLPSPESTHGTPALCPREVLDGKASSPLVPTPIDLDSFNCGPLQVDK
jgi:hypothetical protein